MGVESGWNGGRMSRIVRLEGSWGQRANKVVITLDKLPVKRMLLDAVKAG